MSHEQITIKRPVIAPVRTYPETVITGCLCSGLVVTVGTSGRTLARTKGRRAIRSRPSKREIKRPSRLRSFFSLSLSPPDRHLFVRSVIRSSDRQRPPDSISRCIYTASVLFSMIIKLYKQPSISINCFSLIMQVLYHDAQLLYRD